MPTQPARRNPYDRRRRAHVDDRTVRHWHRTYYQSGLSLAAIGRLTHVNPRYIARRFHELQLPLRRDGRSRARPRPPAAALGSELLALVQGRRKQAGTSDSLALIRTPQQGARMLIAAKIATAVWDALGLGLSGRDREPLVRSAWSYLRSAAFVHDLDSIGCDLDVAAFLRDLQAVSGHDR